MGAKLVGDTLRNDRQPKVALVLDGGGVPGALYQIGVLTALDNYFRGSCATTDFDLFVGTSARAIVGAFLANGVQPQEMFTAIEENQPSPLNFGRHCGVRFCQERGAQFQTALRRPDMPVSHTGLTDDGIGVS